MGSTSTSTSRRVLLVLIGLTCLGSSSLFARDNKAYVSHQARSLQPGEVVCLTVELPEPADRVEAEAFQKKFILYPDGPERLKLWEGLVGIDLDIKPGNYRVKISAFDGGTRILETFYDLEVLPKKFPVRRIKVEDKYVSPPQEELDRIRKESRMVSEIFSKVNRTRLWDGAFSQPVPGDAISSFGKRSIVNGQPRSPHSGTDFRGGTGTPIKAPNAGQVVLVQDLYFAGGTVILDHGLGLYSYFAHLSRFLVSEGDFVRKGDVVGEVGATGRVTGPHLHWTLRLAGTRVDPLSLISVLEGTAEGK